MTYFHGGAAGKVAGDILTGEAPPHVEDGCPVCVARAAGRVCTVGEFLRWVRSTGHPRAATIERQMAGVPWHEPIDPPSSRRAVYMTTDRDYARHYAARSRGDLYRVEPVGVIEHSAEDHFPTWTAPAARVLSVIERGVRLDRAFRRALERRWKKADVRAERKAAGIEGPQSVAAVVAPVPLTTTA